MNPQMMAQAQQMMANMSPEQMQAMQSMVQNMPADQREAYQRQAMAMGGGMPPPSAPAQGGQPLSKELSAATELKGAGNELHKAGKHREAIAKYERAERSLESSSTPVAQDLRTVCKNNVAMCYLKLEEWQPCVDVCTSVLATGPNLKAFYRRGQAEMGMLHWKAAIKDLRAALKLCPTGDAQAELISSKLAVAKAHQPCGQAAEESDSDTPRAPTAGVNYNDGSVTIEEVSDDEPSSTQRAQPRAAASPLGRMPGQFPPGAEEAMQQMADNPQAADEMMSQMDSMSDAEFQQQARMAGMAGMDRRMVKQAMGMMKNLTPEQKRMYAAMAQNMHSGGGGGATPASAASTSAGTRAAMPAAAGAMQPDAQQAAGMMRDMSPEQMDAMMKAAASSGMMPEGTNISPDMLKSASAMMRNMSAEDMQRMQAMSSSMMGPQGGGAAGAGGQMPDMAAMLKDPDAIKSMMSMMRNMSEDDLTSMMKMQRPGTTDAQARQMAKQMQSIDPDSRSIKFLMGAASMATRSYSQAVSFKAWLLANPLALAAVVLILVAVLLRWFGVM